MDVLQVNKLYYPHVGGIEECVRMLSEGLAETGHSPRVLCATEERRGGSQRYNGVPVKKSCRISTLQSVPLSPAFPWHLYQELLTADVVHYHLPNPLAVLSASVIPMSNTPSVVTYHSDIVRQERALRAYRPLLDRFLERVDRIIVTSPRLLDHSEILAQYEDKCRVVPLAINRSSLHTGDSQESRADDDDPKALFVGRLNYYKGVEYLIDAMTEVDATLLIAGDGDRAEELRTRTKRRGVDDRVRFLGFVPDEELDDWYEAADVFVLPSVERSEAFGIVQLEAMAHGLPVVNTDLPTGVPWVSQDGETGRTVPPRDAGALAEALRKLLNDPEERAMFGAKGRERVRQEFTADRMVERTMSVYKELVSSADTD